MLIENDDDDHSGDHGDDHGIDNEFDDDDDDDNSMPDKTLPGLTSSRCFKIKLVKPRKKICDQASEEAEDIENVFY